MSVSFSLWFVPAAEPARNQCSDPAGRGDARGDHGQCRRHAQRTHGSSSWSSLEVDHGPV